MSLFIMDDEMRVSSGLNIDHEETEETVNTLVKSLVCLTQRDQQLAHRIAQQNYGHIQAKLDEVRLSSWSHLHSHGRCRCLKAPA